jgi:hypothetical protein
MQSLYDSLQALVNELDRLPNDHPQWAGSPMREDCIRALKAAEQSVQLTAFGRGLRSRFANWLVSLGRSLANIGGR